MLSFAANGSPYLSIYSGSKSFLMGWTKALVREMKSEKRPIEILAIMTSRVTDTKIEPSGKKTFLKPTAREFAKESLGRVGCGESIIEGWWTHRLLGNVLELLPAWLFTRIFTDAVKEEMRLERKLKKL
jgi:17beta-estradiol 17-dehydrogenase / very-long-chain 3-oxoacyl-CoA reductase